MDPTLLATHEAAALALTQAEVKTKDLLRQLARARGEQTVAKKAFEKAKKALWSQTRTK